MSKTTIRRQIQQLRKRIEKGPRVWKFHGKRVLPVDHWRLEDWSTLPDQYHPGFSLWLKPPPDWWHDYVKLLTKLEDPAFGNMLCTACVIKNAEQAKEEIDQFSWANRGGDKAREEFYATCPPPLVQEFRRETAMRETKHRLFNETAKANNRTCGVLNYFKCPHPQERKQLIHDGREARKLWSSVEWYDRHWNPTYPPSHPPHKT